MKYVSSMEEMGREEGLKEGLAKGLEQGTGQGTGQATRKALSQILETRLGALPGELLESLGQLHDAEILKGLIRSAVLTDSNGDFARTLEVSMTLPVLVVDQQTGKPVAGVPLHLQNQD